MGGSFGSPPSPTNTERLLIMSKPKTPRHQGAIKRRRFNTLFGDHERRGQTAENKAKDRKTADRETRNLTR